GNGMDELSLTGSSEVYEVRDGSIRHFTVNPEELGLALCPVESLRGGDRVENARILLGILDGSEQGSKRDMVLLNAAAGFVVAGMVEDLSAGLKRAREVVENGVALTKLRALQQI